ncbi:MAG: UDP-glucuronic acid decarboxylase family protein [Planctomycetota bacterium]
MSTKRILVTGGAGFLGSHICERLVTAGHDVICLDNLFTSQKNNITHLLGAGNFEFIRHDVTNPITLEVDQIYNMACPASPVHYQYNPIKTMKVSVMGAINMLGMAKRTGARILQASTSEVYGDPTAEHHPQTESYRGNVNPIGIRACYDEGKRAAETLFFDYHRSNGVDIRVVRIFNTYGPRMHPYDGRVVTNFIVQALKGEDLTLYGDGSQTRSFCYCDDLVDVIMAHMNNEPASGNPADAFVGPVNIGNPGEFTIKQLAEKIIEITGSKSKLTYLPLPNDDPLQRKPDISLAKKELGWEPKVALEEGLTKTIEYFRSVDLDSFRKPTDHDAHKSSNAEKH